MKEILKYIGIFVLCGGATFLSTESLFLTVVIGMNSVIIYLQCKMNQHILDFMKTIIEEENENKNTKSN